MANCTLVKGASSFVLETGCFIEDMLPDAFHCFDKSTKKTRGKTIIKYTSTRWLP